MITLHQTPKHSKTFQNGCWLGGMGIGMVLILVLTVDLFAKAYRCVTESGEVILTDSPTQLPNCTPVELKPPAPMSNQPQPPTPPHRPSSATSPPLGGGPPSHHPDDRSTSPHSPESPSDSHDAQDSSEAITIPLAKIGGSLIVQAKLNGVRDVPLILDTGATMTVLSYDVALELGLLNGSDNDVTTVNTAGGPVQVNLAHIEMLQVGGARAHNISVAIHDLPQTIPGVAGLLGMSFLNHFLVTLDSANNILLLQHRR